MEIVEVENFLPQSLQKHLLHILKSEDFSWHYIHDVTQDIHGNSIYNQPGFFNMPVLDGVPRNKNYDIFSFMVPMLVEEFNKHYSDSNLFLSRIRIGMNIPPTSDNTLAEYNTPHIDHDENNSSHIKKNVVALYYVNDVEGDTFIFNETTKSKNYSIMKKISPKMGKLVFFDGNHYHASSCSRSSDVRIVISFNLYEFH